MSILDKVVKTVPRAPRVTVYGRAGIGKSTFAAQFPDPLFLLTEDPALDDIQALPVAESFTETWDNVNELLKEENLPYKTIVLDSVSKLDALIVKHIQDKEDKKGLPLGACCGGYGKGFEAAQNLHRAFKNRFDRFTEKGITVVYVCHVAVTKSKRPDMEDYDVYNIVMNHDKSREPYIDDVDCVLFGRLKATTITTESGRNIVKSTDQRILVTGVNEVNISKNRYKMPNEIPMSFDDFKTYIPFYNLEGSEQ